MSPRLLTIAALVVALFAADLDAQVQLEVRDGEIGGDISFDFQGPPNSVVLNLVSLSAGPTCFPPPHLPDCVPVGLDLFKLSFQIPGFFGSLDANGQASLTFPVPDDPLLDGVILRDVLMEVNSGVLVSASALKKITFAYSDTFALSLGSMAQPRFLSPAIALPDGRVFLAGGSDVPSDHVEAYDPRCEEFSALAFMPLGAVGHTVTLLQNGKILSVGGADFVSGVANRVGQLYDPATNQWSLTAGQPLESRASHTASLLPDGRVLIVGGTKNLSDPATAAASALDRTEIYDPTTDSFSAGPTTADPMVLHTATTLQDGSILVAGGISYVIFLGQRIPALLGESQVYDPGTASWSSQHPLSIARAGHSAVRLPDGRVLLAGGIGGTILTPVFLSSLELGDVTGSSFAASASTLQSGRALPAIVVLPRGDVLVAGGELGSLAASVPVADADLYDPLLDQCVPTNPLEVERTAATAIILPDGSAGVFGGSLSVTEADLYHD